MNDDIRNRIQKLKNRVLLSTYADYVPNFNTKFKTGRKKLATPDACYDSLAKGILPQVDCRSLNLSLVDLSVYKSEWLRFDEKTVFPDKTKMPENFEAEQFFEMGKNPGLGVRDLDVRGEGMAMAIIDSSLCNHQEYEGRLKHYEEIGFGDAPASSREASMHGPAVASLAIGKTVGVAPKAELYYFAVADGDYNPNAENSCEYETQALKKILEINKSITDEKRKIQAVSISKSFFEKDTGFEEWIGVLNETKEAGLFVNTVNVGRDYGLFDGGLNRDVGVDVEKSSAYESISGMVDSREQPSMYPERSSIQKRLFPNHKAEKTDEQQRLLFPMNHRTVAGPQGKDSYTHDSGGGWSWIKPYETALYVLAKEIDPKITPEEFWKNGLKTGKPDEKVDGVMINPPELLKSVQENMQKRDKNHQLEVKNVNDYILTSSQETSVH